MAETGLLPRCLRAKASAAAALSRAVSVSTTMKPVLPSISVMLAMSKPRTCQIPSVTLNSPACAFSIAWRHRLGLTVAGALPSTNLKASKSISTVLPSTARILPSGLAMKPRRASSKPCGSSSRSSRATCSLACTVAGMASPAAPPTPGFLPQDASRAATASNAIAAGRCVVFIIIVSSRFVVIARAGCPLQRGGRVGVGALPMKNFIAKRCTRLP